MSNLVFTNIEDCSDVGVETPTNGLQYIEYMSRKTIKDFSNVKKYTVSYAENSCSELTTQDIAPNYQFQLSIAGCDVVASATPGVLNGSQYTVEVKGINPDFLQLVEECVSSFTVCFPLTITPTGADTFTFTIIGDVNLTANPTRELKITTTSGFEYQITYDFVGQTADDSCDASIVLDTIVYQIPVYLFTPTSTISLNTLVNRNVLLPVLYRVEICEVNQNDEVMCLTNQVTLTCGDSSCVETELCDSTTDICNLSEEVVSVHQGMIYGLDCCKQSKLNIMKHYIRLTCQSILNCINNE